DVSGLARLQVERLPRSRDRGAALEPDDGQLLPGPARQGLGGLEDLQDFTEGVSLLSAEAVRAAARAARFSLVGLAPAEPLDGTPLRRWLEAGYAADMTWMARRTEERLDPGRVLPGAKTVMALAIAYHRPKPEHLAVARYARGRDYHYAHRDRMRDLRRRLLALDPEIETYACVDTGVALEKAWAERAGLGWIGKN